MNAIPEEIESKNVTAVSASAFSVALTDDGQVYVWGDEAPYPNGSAVTPLPEFLSGLTIESIAVGNKHVLVLTDEGEVYGWGREDGTGRLPCRTDTSVKSSLNIGSKSIEDVFTMAVRAIWLGA